ncbi:MAG: pyruvate kinase [Gammaproteobacteria bacterium]|nr:pyruvate kinase [Gammaproteobacteria bacterium]
MAIAPVQVKRKTRIIATLGPATSDYDSVLKLLQAGVNVIRLNMSHGSHDHHRQSFALVRKAAAKLNRHVAIFCDLCGPKIRVGLLEGGSMRLRSRSRVIITTRKVIGRDNVIPCQYPALHKDVKPGDRILLDDGKLELKVSKVEGRDVRCRVVYGGELKDKKGINLPDSQVSSPSLTANDRKDVAFALEQEADFIALSFVRSADDLRKLKRVMQRHGRELPIISKIEKPEALENIDDIIAESYAIMVARGDLGIEIDAARVPMVQKDLISRARSACRPVIVATQMMESMIVDSRPTRAEVGDVSNAALNGADAVMLSGETSVGKYPLQAVNYMSHILQEMEKWQARNPEYLRNVDMNVTYSPRRALANAAVTISHDLDLFGLFVPTSSGITAGVVSAFRPSQPIYGICSQPTTARRMMLHWGIRPVALTQPEHQDWDDMCQQVAQVLKLKLKNQSIIVLAGFGKRSYNNQPVLKILKY